MENNDLRVSINLVWVLAIGGILLIIVGAEAMLHHWGFEYWPLLVGSFLFIATWIVVISDMARSKIYNKTFWIMSMVVWCKNLPALPAPQSRKGNKEEDKRELEKLKELE